MKRQHKVIMLFLPMLIWDTYYYLIKHLYRLSTNIDNVGGDKIDNFLGDE
tara:strand:+ start:453 stop:602 length:150 start_codon:yes stop_codon:yes gene_type:complete